MFVCHLSNTAAWAQPEIKSGQCLDGSISFPGSIETFKFYGNAGASVVIVATETAGNFQPEIFLCTPDGTQVANTWDRVQARIDNHQLAMTGWYRIEIEDYWGNYTGDFDLCLKIFPLGQRAYSEIVGTCNSGIWYRNVAASTWTKMTAFSTSGDIAAGDFTGDDKVDMAQNWSSGLWYQNGATLGWKKVSSLAPHELTAGNIAGK